MWQRHKQQPQYSIAIIGTGFSGIGTAIELEKQFGIKAQLFELSKDVGGTWEAHSYPGLHSDSPSHLYSFSSDPDASWKNFYGNQAEVHTYLQNVARKYQIYERTKFETEVTQAEWDDQEQHWILEWRSVHDHQQIGSGHFDILFAGLGLLRIPNIPKDIVQNFQGPVVHTARWDHYLDYTNKRIAVVGNGATCVQVLPELAKMASHIYNYQRTPAWVASRGQFAYSRLMQFLFRWVPFFMKLYRFYLFIQNEITYYSFTDPDSFLGRRFRRLLTESIATRLTRAGRPDLIPSLIPDYPPGCKRISKSELYYETLAKSNVTLVQSRIESISDRTLKDKDGNGTEVDIVVLATGYEFQGFSGNLKIYGRNKTILAEKWKNEFPKTYKTVTVHGYPNFFILLGPSSNLGYTSVLSQLNIQINFAIKCIKQMIQKNLKAIEPKESAQEEFVTKLNNDFKNQKIWKAGCTSWYLNDGGEIFSIWSALSMPTYDQIFSDNPGAILGGSWGQTTVTTQQSTLMTEKIPKNKQTPGMLKTAAFLNSISDNESEYEDDDAYAPLSMTTWGSQEQQKQQQQVPTNQQVSHDWNSLVDPNYSIKPGGIGSGQLHRQGSNYKPLSETAIVNKRLSKPIPGSGTSSGRLQSLTSMSMIKKKPKKRKKRERVVSMPVHALPEMTVNGWGSGQLTSTPFWEQQQQEQQEQVQQYYDAQEIHNEIYDDDADLEVIPSLKIEIELAPGVTILVTLFKGDTMTSVVEDICRHHHLNMTSESKQALISTLELFIQTKYP
ncbi:hypothetical protein BDA99DRAFT_573639 [Phascolomyces articulosus]|uniref:Uncharacterized protein n=1 Tax=Phascolomyces articulosus TaxID=60185 RepID=A0AAD5JW88_9FUNG|nr:hypothetical protein BDA99DRAFT_573639 [Phascolomyces articulosus]